MFGNGGDPFAAMDQHFQQVQQSMMGGFGGLQQQRQGPSPPFPQQQRVRHAEDLSRPFFFPPAHS